MQILKNKQVSTGFLAGSVVTVGNFDGVHRGHAELFRRLKLQSEKLGLPSVAVTFEPHPLKLIVPKKAPPLITTCDQKAELISEFDIDYLVVVTFDHDFSRTAADEFVKGFLCDRLGMRHIIIGHDYAFGRGRQGNYHTLKSMGELHGFSVESLQPVGEPDTVFSSSLVRSMVLAGNVAGASGILGRYHVLCGQVVHGREIGSMLGFPTANISVCNELIPADGVYAVLAAVDGRLIQGACNIGASPTFAGGERTVEVFLLDFKGELYGRELAFCFVERLRGEKKFDNAAELIKAIGEDVANTRAVLANADLKMVKTVFVKCPKRADGA